MRTKILVISILAIIALGLGGYLYYATTVDYAFAQAKKACKSNDMSHLSERAAGHFNGETRPLTDKERELFDNFASQISQKDECPYDDVFAKKATKTKLGASELERLGVQSGYRYSFEGEDEKKSLTFIKLDGQWYILFIDTSFNQPSQQPQVEYQAQDPTTGGSPTGGTGSPNYQIEVNDPNTTAPSPGL